MSKRYPSGQTNISVDVTIVDDTGLPVTGLVAATFPTVKRSSGTGADATITLSDLTALTDAHSDGGVKERGEGAYRLDLPDLADGTHKIRGEAIDKRLICEDIQVGVVAANVTQWLGAAPATPTVAGVPEVDVTHVGGSAEDVATAAELAKVPKSDGTVAFNTTAVAGLTTAMEAAILNEGDATALLAAIAAKVEEFLINEGDATATIAAIASACNAAVVAGTVGTNVGAIKAKTDNLPASPASTGDVTAARDSVLTRLGTPAGADMAADIAAVKTDTGDLVSRISATLFANITSLAQWLGMLAGKQTGDATALTEMRATGAGSGTFDPTTDSGEALRDGVADAVADEPVDGAVTLRQSMRLHNAALAGKVTGGGTDTNTFRDLADGKDRIVSTVDADGNRSAVTLDLD